MSQNISPGISACIIARNEEQMLAGCLESIQAAVDEIVLVDTGSADRTIEIARQFGCRIFTREWDNDFSAARNFAIGKARFSHILIIDADERLLTPKELRPAIENAAPDTGGWLVEVISEAPNASGGMDTFPARLLRLFVNRPDVRFSGIIHEQTTDSIINAGLKIRNSGIRFRHLGYSSAPDAMRRKNLRNLELLNIALNSDPENAHNLFQRARTYLALGDPDKAEADVARAIELAPPKGSVLPQALNFGAVIARQRGDLPTAESRARRSLELVADQAFPNYILGEIYAAQNRHAEALDSYRAMESAMKSAGTIAGIIGQYHLPTEQVAFRMGRSLVALGRIDESELRFREGLRINPADANCMVGLANIFYKKGQSERALELLRQADAATPGRADIARFMAAVGRSMPQTAQKAEDSPLLSVIMIVKNEEEMLPGCLESVRNVADEFIVVDTGSTDSTREIARNLGAKVYEYEWADDFADARNESLRHATGRWALYIDADERLRIAHPERLRHLLATADEEIGGFILTIESQHKNLTGSTELHRGGYPRLFRNYGYPKIKFTGRVHEQIAPSILDLDKSFARTDLVIEHLGYDRPREEMEKKIKRNYKMLIQHVNEEPLNGYAWYQLGQTLGQMRLVAEAEEAIRFAIKCGNLSDSVYASAAATLAQFTGNAKKFEEALHWADESLGRAPEQMYALNLKAYALLYLGRGEEAVPLFEEALRRLSAKRGVPQSGFDIILPEHVVREGLDRALKSIEN
ncbi:MAG: glycosyltransferase [Candidatus Kapaibacterium sp.]